jgi:hypothetical protein
MAAAIGGLRRRGCGHPDVEPPWIADTFGRRQARREFRATKPLPDWPLHPDSLDSNPEMINTGITFSPMHYFLRQELHKANVADPMCEEPT